MIKPLLDNILLEKIASEKKVGSIVLTSEKKTGNVATVIAVGPGKEENGKFIATTLKPGEKVIYRAYSGTEYEDDGHKYLLIKEEDILAIVE